jgi:carboxylate-amine ligase
MSRALADDEPIDRLPYWFMRENKWRAARYGLAADVITPRKDQYLLHIDEGILQWVEHLGPIAEQLGCAEELGHVAELVRLGPSYLRQRRIVAAGGTVQDATRSLVEELRTGNPIYKEK